jgi:hypothetical protein
MSKNTFSEQYTALINDAVKNLPVPAEVSTFLLDVWVDVLASSAMRYGPDHINTLALKKTVMDLVWVSEAKRTRRSRSRTVKETPQLMDRIRDGMRLIGLTLDQQAAHVEKISGPLLDAFLAIEARRSPVSPSVHDRPLLDSDRAPATKDDHTHLLLGTPDLVVTEKQSDSVWSLFEDVVKSQQKA